MRIPRLSWRVAAGAGCVAVLAACGTAGADTGGDSSLLIWAGTGTGGDALQEVAAQFGSEAGVDVTVELVPGDQLQQNFVTASQGNNAPDVVCGAHDWIGNLVQNGAIDPVQLPEAVRGHLQPLAVEAVTYNSRTYGIPFTMNSLVLYRNTALVPEEPASIEELVARGKELVASDQVDEVMAYPVGTTGNPYFIQPLYTAGGGYMFGEAESGGYDPGDLGVGEPGSVAAYERIGALGEGGEQVLKRSISADNALSLFTEGQTAFLVEGPWQLPNLAATDVAYAVSAIPGYEGGGPARPFITVDACYAASQGENKVFAQEFLTAFWARPDVQLTYFESARAVPASTEVLGRIRESAPDVATAADIGARFGDIMPSIPEMAAVWDPLGKAQAAVVAGADPESTITQAGTTIRQAIGN